MAPTLEARDDCHSGRNAFICTHHATLDGETVHVALAYDSEVCGMWNDAGDRSVVFWNGYASPDWEHAIDQPGCRWPDAYKLWHGFYPIVSVTPDDLEKARSALLQNFLELNS